MKSNLVWFSDGILPSDKNMFEVTQEPPHHLSIKFNEHSKWCCVFFFVGFLFFQMLLSNESSIAFRVSSVELLNRKTFLGPQLETSRCSKLLVLDLRPTFDLLLVWLPPRLLALENLCPSPFANKLISQLTESCTHFWEASLSP